MISIVIAYYNRREQFLRTLKSIQYFGNPEIIVVDDASDEEHRLEDVKGITLIRINKEDKNRVNTCIPYNIGLAQAHGDVVVIQNAECVHTGDILSYCGKIERGVAFSFAAYSLDRDLPFSADTMMVGELREMILKERPRTPNGHHGWYNHSKYRDVRYHFCNAYTRDDIYAIGGFDERYAEGLAYEDDEFLTRTKRAGVDLRIVDDPFVIHQKHIRTDYGKTNRDGYARNRDLFTTVTSPGRFIKPPKNEFFMSFVDPASATHTPLVRLALDAFKPQYILEIGVGWFSSTLFNNYVNDNPDVGYKGIENDQVWITDVKEKCPVLDIIHHDIGDIKRGQYAGTLSQYWSDKIRAYYEAIEIPDRQPRLLFVDNYASCRVIALSALRDKFDYIIFHDCEMGVMNCYGYDTIDTEGFDVYYLKSNLAWAALMVRKGCGIDGLIEAAQPFIKDFDDSYGAVKYMQMSLSYL